MDDLIHSKLNLNPILFLFLFPHTEAQSPMQPASPFANHTIWDVSSIVIIIGAFIATFLLVTVFSIFLSHCGHSHPTSSQNHSGIHPQILQTFPILFYSSINNHLKREDPLQCAVCLSDFNHQDTLRLLPQCNHVFHPPCIDAWLSSHVTCPVCRAILDQPLHSVAIAVDGEGSTSEGCGEGRRNGDEEDKGVVERASKSKLLRSNSTGHSVVEDVERYTLRLPEDVKKSIMVNHGVMLQRSASYNFVGSSMKGLCWSDSDGSSRGKRHSIGLMGKEKKLACWWCSVMDEAEERIKGYGVFSPEFGLKSGGYHCCTQTEVTQKAPCKMLL
ncbi:Zinc finger, RING-type [Sesbania bispinosa]|nr:Zinc finger, RING-type [Sesbania bispinosa]